MDISVVVACYNEEGNIYRCLNSLVNQNHPSGRLEVVVVDGGSQDETVAIICLFTAGHDNIHLVHEPRKGTAIARNAGLAASRFPYVAFLDADCEAPADWLSRLSASYLDHHARDPAVAAVGGGNRPAPDSEPFVLAVGIAVDSYAGSFNSVQGRNFPHPREVASLATLNVLYDKAVLVALQGFDNSLASEAEDAEINYRLRYHGHRLIFIPQLTVLHKYRATPLLWYRNMFRYGRGRGRLLKRYPAMWSFSFTLPPLFLLGQLSLLLAFWHPLFWLALLYFPAILLFALVLCLRKKSVHLVLYVATVFIVQHFGYALGLVTALANPNVR